jgi:hypothetical protein
MVKSLHDGLNIPYESLLAEGPATGPNLNSLKRKAPRGAGLGAAKSPD